jgi:hypothetical protein
MTLEPRVWLAFVDPVDEEIVEKDTHPLPMAGFTAAVRPEANGGYAFLFTLLRGGAEGDIEGDGGEDGDTDIDRLDLELLLRYDIPDTSFFLLAGPRYVRQDETNKAAGMKIDLEERHWLFEVGAGADIDLTPDARHRLLAGLVAGAGRYSRDWDSDIADSDSDDSSELSLEASLGYRFMLGESASFRVGYRALLMTLESDTGDGELQVLHGLELTFAFDF